MPFKIDKIGESFHQNDSRFEVYSKSQMLQEQNTRLIGQFFPSPTVGLPTPGRRNRFRDRDRP